MDENPELPLRAVDRTLSDGRSHLFLQHKDSKPSVAVVVRHSEEFLLIKVRRPVIGEGSFWEIPRGFSDDEDACVAGRREVHEEVGLSVNRIREIGLLYADSGAIAQPTVILEAIVDDTNVNLQEEEMIEDARWVTLHETEAMIRSGEIQDGFTLGAFAILRSSSLPVERRNQGSDSLREFFLNDTAENMRATETKQVQLAAGVAAATAAFVAIVFSESTSVLVATPRRTVGLAAIFLWSLASSTKMLRYRSWKEHYADRLKALVGRDFNPDAPVIYRPDGQNTGRLATVARRVWRDESLTGVSIVLVLSSAAVLMYMCIRWINDDYGTGILVVASALLAGVGSSIVRLLVVAAKPIR